MTAWKLVTFCFRPIKTVRAVCAVRKNWICMKVTFQTDQETERFMTAFIKRWENRF